MRLHSPCDHLTCLSLRQYTAQHEPAVLGQHSSIEEFQFCIIATDRDHVFRIISSHHDAMTRLKREGIHKAIRTTVIVGLEAFELTRFLTVGTGNGLTRCITRETVQTTVHDEGLQPIFRGQELQIKTSFASQFFRYGLIEPYGNLHRLTLCCYYSTTVEVIIVVTHGHLNTTILTVHLPAGHLRHEVPLFRRIVQSYGTTLNRPYTVLYNLNTRVLLVIEATVETVAEYQNIHSLTFEVLTVVQLQILSMTNSNSCQ